MKDQFIDEYINFLNASPTPYHAVTECISILKNNSFKRLTSLKENIPPGKYYIKHNKTLFIAFTIPGNLDKNASLKLIATHSDSPVLKLKPTCIKRVNNEAIVSLSCYGGGLWHTWFDRPLGIAGQVIDEDLKSRLVFERKPLFYIPSLAIHLNNNDVYKDGFVYNKEIHLNAICNFDNTEYEQDTESSSNAHNVKFIIGKCKISPEINNNSKKDEMEFSNKEINTDNLIFNEETEKGEINSFSNTGTKNDVINDINEKFDNFYKEAINGETDDKNEITNSLNEGSVFGKERPAENVSEFNKSNISDKEIKADNISEILQGRDILNHDLSLFDIQEATRGGINNKYIFSGRQDNLLSTFCGIKAILKESSSINILLVYDHEEVGSQTTTGAQTEITNILLSNLMSTYNVDIKNSFIVSCHVAHAFNPNYPNKYEVNHRPLLGKGMVVKYSTFYATNNYTAAFIKSIAKRYQEFALRNDCRGGSTIGPMLCARTGIQGVDIGAPVLGMHSVKEVSHVDDVYENYELFTSFYLVNLHKK